MWRRPTLAALRYPGARLTIFRFTDRCAAASARSPLLSVALASVVRQRRAHLVNWLQDIYPETASILGVPLLRGPVASALATLRNRSLREADATVVVGELMARHIKELGAVPARVHVIANWCDDETIRPAAGTDNPLR